ncbi:YidH family protein [Chelatococcus reniformis]|uniref:DUF202 domain-containing protein n=1 Tax=Chelatococcus reniformis TaxID=1494448 RepID=A0A916TXN9_9HYPH|nr:DUF202 domain-containing protein [Chelatococcus reniformis]GGC49120.1 hypothetical protein GCM10010994_05310 [Chelatococcus reniformis]
MSARPSAEGTAPGNRQPDDAPHGRFEVRVTADSHFAWLRTRLAVERTLMSWVRTSVSLIGFGFTIVQFFDHLQAMTGVRPLRFPDAAWYFGLSLIFCGIAGLVISLWQYRWTVRYLWGGSFAPLAGMTREGLRTPIVAVASLLILIGLFAFGAVLLNAV